MWRCSGVMLVLLCLFSTVLLLLFPSTTRECATNGLCVRFDGTSQQTCRAKVFCASSHSLCCSVHHVGCWSFAKQVVSWKMWRCSGVMLVLLCLFSTVLLLLFPSMTRECATNGLCVRFDGTSQQTCRAKVFCASSHSLCCSVHHVGCWSFAKQVVSWKMWRCSGAMLVLLCLFSTVLLLLFPGMTRECATNGLCVRVHRRTAYVAAFIM